MLNKCTLMSHSSNVDSQQGGNGSHNIDNDLDLVHMGNKDIITLILVKIPNIDTNDTLDRADKVDKYCQ